MKKIYLLFLLPLFLLSSSLHAGNHEFFSYDEERVKEVTAEMTALESHLLENGTLSAKDMMAEQNLVLALNPGGLAFTFDDMQWDSFAWGFCCWPIGIFTVLLNEDKDKNHKISYFIGWGTSIVLGSISYCGQAVYLGAGKL